MIILWCEYIRFGYMTSGLKDLGIRVYSLSGLPYIYMYINKYHPVGPPDLTAVRSSHGCYEREHPCAGKSCRSSFGGIGGPRTADDCAACQSPTSAPSKGAAIWALIIPLLQSDMETHTNPSKRNRRLCRTPFGLPC